MSIVPFDLGFRRRRSDERHPLVSVFPFRFPRLGARFSNCAFGSARLRLLDPWLEPTRHANFATEGSFQ